MGSYVIFLGRVYLQLISTSLSFSAFDKSSLLFPEVQMMMKN